MELPKLERSTYKVKVDSVELILTEPTLEQAERMNNVKDLNGENENVIDKVADVLSELMDGYEASKEDKIRFIKSLSYRQLSIIESELTRLATEKKVVAESVQSTSQSPKKQGGH